MVEQLAVNQWVPGSSPGSRAMLSFKRVKRMSRKNIVVGPVNKF